MKTAIIGAGGQGIMALRAMQEQDAKNGIKADYVFLDQDTTLHGTEICGAPVLPEPDMVANDIDAMFVAIGDNELREKLFNRLLKQKIALRTIIHPSAFVDPTASIGRGSIIMPGAVVNAFARIGENVIINSNATIEHHGVVGAHSHIAPGVTFGGEVTVGTRTLIGLNSTVLPRLSIGDDVIVGAHCLVRKDVSDSRKILTK